MKMASAIPLVMAAAVAAVLLGFASASDPDLITDFAVPVGVNSSSLTEDFFTFKEFRGGVGTKPGTFAAKKMFVEQMPAISGLGVSLVLFEYSPGTMNPLHTHPRGTEVIYVLDGTLDVGVVDTSNKLFEQTLMKGDVFVFPKGLVHYQINRSNTTVCAIAALSSSNPGLLSLPSNLFSSGIPADVLSKAFHVSQGLVKHVSKAVAPPAVPARP